MWYFGEDGSEEEELLERQESGNSTSENRQSAPTTSPPVQVSPVSTSIPRVVPPELHRDKETIRSFLRAHKCYDLIPVSSKIVVIDTALPVKAAFVALIDNEVKSAPLWDAKLRNYVGMITVTDFRNILRHFHKTQPSKALSHELETHAIRTWREIISTELPSSLIYAEPEDSLYEAACLLLKHHIHRLPIIDKTDNTILHIITHRRINNFLVQNLQSRVELLQQTLEELDIGTYTSIITATKDTPLIKILDLLAERNISAVPIVDHQEIVQDVYSNSDITYTARNRTYDDLDRPVNDVLARKQKAHQKIHTCLKTDKLWDVLQRFFQTKVHRLICVDEVGRVIGIVSMSDILKAFIT
jgi:5'-AMP-activated protein kinase regulatory gamma subunit